MLRAIYASGECLENCKKLKMKDFPLCWIDLLNPTEEEETTVETILGIVVPTKAEASEIEQSSRLYQENSAIYLTASLPLEKEGHRLEITPITFILTGTTILTVHYEEISILNGLLSKPGRLKIHEHKQDLLSTMNGLIDVLVDYLADLLEKSIAEVNIISKTLFYHQDITSGSIKKESHHYFDKILFKIGIQGDALSALRDSLLSFTRLIGFLNQRTDKTHFGLEESTLLTADKDLLSISNHALFVSSKVSFLLQATLGMINIDQNRTIKTFSIASVIFLPPTLLASVWGMNYSHMPELNFQFGYPIALICIILSSIIPYLYFKKKQWL